MVADNQSNIGIQIAGLPLPQQLDQTMVFFGDEDRQSLLMAHVKNLPLHLKAVSDFGKITAHLIQPLCKLRQVKLHSHEEHAAIGVHCVLVGLDDICSELE
ncbi:hypothetical protein D3C73_1144440 [compost metagenome]